jgi:hypothetical protein
MVTTSISQSRTFAPNFENFNFIGTGDGDDKIFANVIYNEGVINTGNGNDSIIVSEASHTGGGNIYNNGGSIDTGDGNDSIIAEGGFQSGLNSSGAWFLGEGEDYIILEKFHDTAHSDQQLLDLANFFWGKFLKFDSISCFVFLWDVYRVSLDPVIFCGACGAPITRPGGRATLSCPPGPRLAIAKPH